MKSETAIYDLISIDHNALSYFESLQAGSDRKGTYLTEIFQEKPIATEHTEKNRMKNNTLSLSVCFVANAVFFTVISLSKCHSSLREDGMDSSILKEI